MPATIERTGKVTEIYVAIILTFTNGQVGRFQMLEDNYAGSHAAS